MASYEQAPDTQSYTNLRPYEMPYNQIMQTVQAKTNYWLQGANQLKSAYQQSAGLDLSLDQNRNALRDFSSQANDQINKAAKSDLSIADNVNDAMHIFDPLYDGKSELSQNIMGDHAVTTRAKLIQSQFQEAKTKNNGKEYSPINEQDALQSYQDFIKNGDPKGWKEAYQGIRGYTPYYDYHKEFADAAKGCHGNSTSSVGVNGMYITSETTSGVDANKMAGCLGSNLSPNAENQLAIEARVRYGRNYNALADDYKPIALQNRDIILSQKARLAAALIDPKTSPDMKATIQQQIKGYDDQVSNIETGLGAIDKGDLSYIKNNYDQLSSAVYRGQKISSMANAFSYVDNQKSIKADPVQMMYARFKEDQNLLTQKEGFDMARLKEEYKLKAELQRDKLNKGIGEITPFTPTTDPDAAPKKTAADFQAEKAATAVQMRDSELSLYQHLKNSPVTKDVVVGEPGTSVFASSKDAILGNPDVIAQDPWLAAWKDKNDRLNVQKNIQLSTEQAINTSKPVTDAKNAVAKFVAGVNQDQLVPLRETATGSQVTTHFTAKDIQNLLLGQPTSSGAVMSKVMSFPQAQYAAIPGSYQDVIKIGGKNYDLPPFMQSLLVQRDQHLKGYQDIIDNAYNQHYVNNPQFGNLTAYNGEDKKQVQSTLSANLSGLMSIPEDKDLKVVSTAWDGRVQFTIPATNKGKFPDQSDLTVAARKMGLQNIVAVPGVPGMYEASGVQQFNRSGDVLFAHQLQQYAENLQTIAKQSGTAFPRTPMLQDYHGINITAMEDPNGQLIYELQDKANPSQIGYATSPTDLLSKLQQLTAK